MIVVTPTIAVLTEYTPCRGCGFLLRPSQTFNPTDPGNAFYLTAGRQGPYCLACWNKPRGTLPSYGMRNAPGASRHLRGRHP